MAELTAGPAEQPEWGSGSGTLLTCPELPFWAGCRALPSTKPQTTGLEPVPTVLGKVPHPGRSSGIFRENVSLGREESGLDKKRQNWMLWVWSDAFSNL